MPRNVEDIVPRGGGSSRDKSGRSIRNIPIPETRRKSINQIDAVRPREEALPVEKPQRVERRESINPVTVQDEPYRAYSSPRGGGVSKKKLFTTIGVALVVLALIVLSLTGGATLAYTPKSAPISFDNDIYLANKSGDTGLLFSVVKLSGDKGLSVSATGEEDVSVKASGKIVVYNNASVETQRLLINTRFETPDGKIYRSTTPIVIPGRKIVNGTTQPGSVEITVVADAAGESYNIGLTDFTVPGLKGDTRYQNIYARSKTPMTGGFVGKRKDVSEENLASTKTELEKTLKAELITQTQAQVPEDFILFPSLTTITYEDLPQSGATENSVTVNMRGHLYGVMFKRSDLATHLSSKKLTLAGGEMVNIANLEALDVGWNGAVPADLLKANQVSLKISGTGTVLWRTDEDALRNDLVGRSKSDTAFILKNYPSIVSADAIIRPFWKTSFPKDAREITIREQTVK